ncbi:hypothetical protein F5148DRAFT_1162634 [Russula earlei]|uniref:Uncharacterized protein n=1 Tax=Russula earlei TaxID=71964 RepID=A0ACC0UMN6_9AGAM|nr:hypothetical protein F5148DRAFT_1162634 [Russula earlei]
MTTTRSLRVSRPLRSLSALFVPPSRSFHHHHLLHLSKTTLPTWPTSFAPSSTMSSLSSSFHAFPVRHLAPSSTTSSLSSPLSCFPSPRPRAFVDHIITLVFLSSRARLTLDLLSPRNRLHLHLRHQACPRPSFIAYRFLLRCPASSRPPFIASPRRDHYDLPPFPVVTAVRSEGSVPRRRAPFIIAASRTSRTLPLGFCLAMNSDSVCSL